MKSSECRLAREYDLDAAFTVVARLPALFFGTFYHFLDFYEIGDSKLLLFYLRHVVLRKTSPCSTISSLFRIKLQD